MEATQCLACNEPLPEAAASCPKCGQAVPAGPKGVKRRASSSLKCSFCGKGQKEVRKLIAGPTVYICDECIMLCNEIVAADARRADEDGEPPWLGKDLRDSLEFHLKNSIDYFISVRSRVPYDEIPTMLGGVVTWIEENGDQAPIYGFESDHISGVGRSNRYGTNRDLTKPYYIRAQAPNGEWKSYPARALWFLHRDEAPVVLSIDYDDRYVYVEVVAEKLEMADSIMQGIEQEAKKLDAG